jgi:hypothetical protein
METTTAFILDKRRQKNDGTYPVKLRITFNRKSKIYKTKYSFSEEDFEKISAPKPRGTFKDDKIALNEIEIKATNVINDLPFFTFESFEKRYLKVNFDKTNLFSYYEEKINELINVESLRTADVYKCAKTSLSSFLDKSKLSLLDITPEFLKKYELWMRRENKSVTTTSMYLRTLRHIFNRAMEETSFDPKHYPFKKNH